MNELEKKFSCLCGSEVKEANRKAHEKTKKHMNYQQTHGTSNLIPGQSLPVPKAVRKLQQKRKYEETEPEEDEDDDYEDDQDQEDPEQGDEQDDGFEEELLQAIEAIHQGVESLVIDKSLLRKDMLANINKTVTDVGLLLNPLLNSINDRLKFIEDRVEEIRLKNLSILGELRELHLNTRNIRDIKVDPETQKWINDKCTQRNA